MFELTVQPCPKCKGKGGWWQLTEPYYASSPQMKRLCSVCSGTGHVIGVDPTAPTVEEVLKAAVEMITEVQLEGVGDEGELPWEWIDPMRSTKDELLDRAVNYGRNGKSPHQGQGGMMTKTLEWERQEAGWYTHPDLGDICHKANGWVWYPLGKESGYVTACFCGPFGTLKEAIDWAEFPVPTVGKEE